jgi:ribosomal protein S18 acetylase RimI-like enzyme
MKYGDIKIYGKGHTTLQEYEGAQRLLAEEFPDHEHTNLKFYDYFFVAKILGEDQEIVVGIITANKYLPDKVQICDITVHKQYRAKAVGLKLLNTLTQKVKRDGYTYITGMTNKKNREAINLYRKLGGHQEEMIVTTASVDETIAVMNHKEMVLKHREKRREKE